MNQPSDPNEGRKFKRKSTMLGARLILGDNVYDSEIVNISFGGAQVRVEGTLNSKDMVILEIKPFEFFETELKWSDGKGVGIKFKNDPEKVAEPVMAIATYV